jgi:multisubunit Na+/H+ antiporter MnhG subunit
MNFDLRRPIGAMFTLLGAMLAFYGLIARPEIYERSFGMNVNLIWGAVLLVFGGGMLWFGRHAESS